MDNQDKRKVCQYGLKCFRKNPEHLAKFKHPPRKPADLVTSPPKKKQKIANVKISNDISDSDEDVVKTETQKVEEIKVDNSSTVEEPEIKQVDGDDAVDDDDLVGEEPSDFKEYIKQRFLVEMPEDFYTFWQFCEKTDSRNPLQALKSLELELVGPFEVLAGKFKQCRIKSAKKYLLHWRYYYDPPEFQTVIKGSDKNGFHIGYFRDDPKEEPIFVASNYGKVDGVLEVLGSNIFAAVYNHCQALLKNADPFKKLQVGKVQTSLKQHCNTMKIELTKSNEKIRRRNNKIVTKLFNKIGLVVPYNKKTELGYRELALNNKDLNALLLKLKNASEEQRTKYFSDLQPVLTYASIALDECDFGTGLELGLNLLYYGIDALNATTGRFLTNSYNLLHRNEFAKIANAHMADRRKGTSLSII